MEQVQIEGTRSVKRQKAENEYEKYKIIQDKKFVSDFDKLLIETEKLENH